MPRKRDSMRRAPPRLKRKQYDSPRVVRQAVGDTKLEPVKLDMEAASRALYENFIRVFQIDHGVTVDGRRKSPASWEQNKEFQRKNWREVAQAVVDAATGVLRKKRNTA